MARINVSVPDSLKERMSALDDRVNWSEVAQTAFEREVAIRTFKGDDMEDVIERLRSSKAEYETEARGDGLLHGQDWAKRIASFKDLRELAKVDFGSRNYEEFEMALFVDGALGRDTRNDPDESLWSDGDGDLDLPINSYVEAYVEGAKQIWDEVNGKI
jgi:hypothetical protein